MAETSIVIELQRMAMNGNAPVTDLLRNAMVVATKLKIADFEKWVECELDGYLKPDSEVPPYRKTTADLRAFNPFNGINMPVAFEDPRIARILTQVEIRNPIAEIEDMAKSGKNASLSLTPEESNYLRACSDPTFHDMPPRKHIAGNVLVGIGSSVRNAVLRWSLNLEASGIMGYGMTFSNDEKKAAANSPSIHIGSIGTFNGNFAAGDINAGGNIQIGGFSSINDQLKNAGISQSERNHLETIMDDLHAAKPEDKPGIIKRGMEWVNKNKAALGTLAVQLTSYFTGHHKG